MNIKTILIDDEPKALKALENKLAKYCPTIQVIGKGHSAEEGYQLIVEHRPQLVFLDIAMPEETGFDLLKRLPYLNFELIFVTGFDEYAIEAFRFSAVGYILKPVESSDIIQAVENAKQRIGLKIENIRNQQLLENMAQPLSRKNKIGIATSESIEFIGVENIIRCEGLQRCTNVIIKNQKNLVSSYNLGEFVKLLENYGFYSPHRSHLINLSHVQRYEREGTILMSDQSAIPVARRKKQDFLEQLKHL